MGAIFKGKNINGLIYKGVEYIKKPPRIITEYNYSFNKKVSVSAGTEYTSGYKVTFSFATASFKLYKYNDINTALNYLPSYKFIYSNVTQQELTSLKLIYNGDETFSISGEIGLGDVYSSSKTAGSGVAISLVDENNNFFLSTSAVLSSSTATSSTTVDAFIGSTLTFETETNVLKVEKIITLPYSRASATTSGPTRYPTTTGTTLISYSEIKEIIE